MPKPAQPVPHYSHIYAKDNGYVVEVYTVTGKYLYDLKTADGRATHNGFWPAVEAAKRHGRGLTRLPRHLGGK